MVQFPCSHRKWCGTLNTMFYHRPSIAANNCLVLTRKHYRLRRSTLLVLKTWISLEKSISSVCIWSWLNPVLTGDHTHSSNSKHEATTILQHLVVAATHDLSNLPNHPLRDPRLRGRMNQRQWHLDLPRSDVDTLALPPTKLCKRACPDDADRREAHLRVLDVGRHERVKQAIWRSVCVGACRERWSLLSRRAIASPPLRKEGKRLHAPRGPEGSTKKPTVAGTARASITVVNS